MKTVHRLTNFTLKQAYKSFFTFVQEVVFYGQGPCYHQLLTTERERARDTSEPEPSENQARNNTPVRVCPKWINNQQASTPFLRLSRKN